MALAGACCRSRYKRPAEGLLRGLAHPNTAECGAYGCGSWWPGTGIPCSRVAGAVFGPSLSGQLWVGLVSWFLADRAVLHRSQLPLAALWQVRSWVHNS